MTNEAGQKKGAAVLPLRSQLDDIVTNTETGTRGGKRNGIFDGFYA